MPISSTKRCGRCARIKSREEFHRNRARKDGLQSACKECQRSYVQAHFDADPAYYRKKASKRNRVVRADIRKLIRGAKAVPCSDCGVRYPYYVMDFDHVRGKKRFNVGEGLATHSPAVVRREIDKCDVVCANCHRTREHVKRVRKRAAQGWPED
ncbi:MAG: hypothetical protein JJ896_12815 [Rhodothermales bacterium]|nr:hypothetical protein [Rhodothermales bacterium]MBO6780528.1 hypothetical protein [Rhodothermales bacterium]